MKKTLFLLLLCLTTLSVWAQKTPLEKYNIVPESYDELYYRYVKDFVVKKLPSSLGYYYGQISDDSQLEGYASYEGLEGGTIIGQYFRGTLLFGITMTKEVVNVGSKEYYASYSATTGELIGVNKGAIFERASAQDAKAYQFGKMTYGNGDRYVGEIYNGKRHGYGVYYFANGGYWYGPFNENAQSGYGAYFTSEGGLKIGKW